MSIKSKVLAAAATLTLVSGVGAAGALTAGTATAATPSCGHRCIDIFSREFGFHFSPNFVMDVLRQGMKVGQPLILFRTSNTDPAEDFTIAYQGQVSDFYAAGMVGPGVNLHYGGGCAYLIPGATPPCQAFYPDDPAFGFPTDKPRPQLKVTNLTGFSHGFPPGPILSTVNSNQLWGAAFGVLR